LREAEERIKQVEDVRLRDETVHSAIDTARAEELKQSRSRELARIDECNSMLRDLEAARAQAGRDSWNLAALQRTISGKDRAKRMNGHVERDDALNCAIVLANKRRDECESLKRTYRGVQEVRGCCPSAQELDKVVAERESYRQGYENVIRV